MISASFDLPPPHLRLSANEAHIWIASLAQAKISINNFTQALSNAEKSRSKRFYFDSDRERYIVAHGILRTICGRYLNVDPSRLQFCNGKNGKPTLADTFDKGTIHFNESRSAGLAIFGFTRSREIGVDVERIRDIPEMNDIVEQLFTESEKTSFHSLGDTLKQEAFFKCWTRKEAFLKAMGVGLFRPLNSFDVSVAAGEPARLLTIEGDSKRASRWSIQDLRPAPGYAAAFAIKGQSCQLHCYQWSD